MIEPEAPALNSAASDAREVEHLELDLQQHVHDLLYESLATFGVLGLGSKESIRFSGRERDYEALDEASKLYRRVR